MIQLSGSGGEALSVIDTSPNGQVFGMQAALSDAGYQTTLTINGLSISCVDGRPFTVTAPDGADMVIGIANGMLVANGVEGGTEYVSLPQAVQHLLDKSCPPGDPLATRQSWQSRISYQLQVLAMQSTRPEYLGRQRKALKRTRIFEDATYAGKSLRAQSLTQDVIEMLVDQEMLTTQIQALVDWTDLDAEPQYGDVLTFTKRAVSFEVVSYKLQGDGFCRLVLRNG